MVVVQVADDDVLDLTRVDADRLQAFSDRLEQLPLALLPHRLVEAGVDDEDAGPTDDRPDVVVERLQDVVRITAEKVLGRLPFVARVSDGVDLVDVVAHASPHRFGSAHLHC